MDKNRKFFIITLGTTGDIHPFIGISRGLRKMGHDVTFLTNEYFRNLILHAGIKFQPIGTDSEYKTFINNHEIWEMSRGFGPLWQYVEVTIERTIKYIENEITASGCNIISHPITVSTARIAKERFNNIKLLTVYLSPHNLRSYYDPQIIGSKFVSAQIPKHTKKDIYRSIDENVINPASVPGLNLIRNNLNLPPIRHLRDHMQEGADISIALFPEWFSKYQPDWPENLVAGDFLLYDPNLGDNIPGHVDQFLKNGPPPVIFTYGTGMRHANNFFQTSLEICNRLNIRAIFLNKNQEQIPDNLPNTILYCEYVPFALLLKRTAGIVHHGGIGSCAEALKAGIPQIIVPMIHDQFHNAFRIEQLGLGLSVKQNKYNVTNMTSAIEKLLNSESIQKNCKNISNQFHPNPIKRICHLIVNEISGISA